MGRMLDSLNPINGSVNGQHGNAAESKAAVAEPAGPAPIVETSEVATSEEEFPYIEVGAPGKKVEASPSVLAALPPAPVKAPPRSTPAQPTPTLVPMLTEPRPVGASFAAWPTPRANPAIPRDVIAFHQPDHPVARQYRELFSQIIGELKSAGGRVVLCAGAAPQVGTTTVLVNMAFTSPPTGERCEERHILVEANWQRPALAQRLGLPNLPGLRDVLAGTTALEHAVIPTARPHLFALTAASVAASAAESRSHADHVPPAAWSWVLHWLRERFDVIFVDAPDLSDTEVLKPLVAVSDAVYLVLPQDSAPAQVNSWTHSLSRLGGRVRGLIHTQLQNP